MKKILVFRHHCIVHPIVGILYIIGFQACGDWLHNNW